ncbi:Gti1/Pac2 family-domain-containing protein [Vararia minispora EC-137]|uniref:Gti1/Pac2 family-domain-containing protein n=1 Tax=Vararia minispora EC-137 TaxID=1314806 RepID=A0ACB8QKT8_9AGAM|nr:Gti1/Pac2 family-domain-containing protein [Vararia minispora EC-137]
MQRPTHARLHVRDARDAHTVFEAVRLGLLKPVERRLNEIERATFIQSGAIFVWEESEDDLGLKRWTDGRVWSQSRMREPYLFYDERTPDGSEVGPPSPRSSHNFRFVDGISRSTYSTPALSHYDRSEHHPTGLVKQAYSAWVLGQPGAKPRKWHLTAYFTYADLPRIPTIDQDPALNRITIPAGMYKSGKARSRNSDAGSPPSSPSPPPYVHPTGACSPSSPRPGMDARVTLPSLHSAFAPYADASANAARRVHDAGRLPEDARMIRILNSRHIM